MVLKLRDLNRAYEHKSLVIRNYSDFPRTKVSPFYIIPMWSCSQGAKFPVACMGVCTCLDEMEWSTEPDVQCTTTGHSTRVDRI